jgi:uncharacterized protein YecE (DUF72 family)
MPDTRIGISGWRYGPWRGTFYPEDLAQKRELEYASRKVNSIEINGTFYSLQRPDSFAQWYDATPEGFLFSLKGGRFITHMKKLKDVETPLANFFASGVLRLKEKMGPVLWQLPPNLGFDRDRIERFLELLPRDTESAVKLARKHDERLKGRAYVRTDENHPIRHAMEIRHPTFQCAEFVDLLRKHKVALVFAETAGKWPYFEDATADFVYARLHGDKELYVSGYNDAALDRWAQRLKTWEQGDEPADARRVGAPVNRCAPRDVYVYFDNDVKVRAPFDAMGLAHRLGASGLAETLDEAKLKSVASLPRQRWPGFRRTTARPAVSTNSGQARGASKRGKSTFKRK